jgi:hypothetical protein
MVAVDSSLSWAQPTTLYQKDFYGWTQEQARLLQPGLWPQLDIPKLFEELEASGRQQRQELRNRLGVRLG